MKKFFLSDVKEGSMQAAYLFITANTVSYTHLRAHET